MAPCAGHGAFPAGIRESRRAGAYLANVALRLQNRALMRRIPLAAALLAALVAAPATVLAQAQPASGEVTFDNAFIGADACSSTATSTQTVRMTWLDQLDTTNIAAVPAAGVFRIFSTNVAPGATAPRFCATQNNPNATGGPVFAGQVGDDIANTGTQLSGVANGVSKSEIAQRAGYGACTQDGVAITVCVHFYPYQPGTTVPSANATAWAVGTMTVSLTRPSAVHLDKILPGNGALNVSWSDNASPRAAKYKVRAISLADPAVLPDGSEFDPAVAHTFDPRDPVRHETGFVTGTGPFRMAGLVNYVPYAVAVYAYTSAETASDPSNVASSEPQVVNDFWRTYKDAGGVETGGCSAGFAGPLGLGILLATLALVRRRK